MNVPVDNSVIKFELSDAMKEEPEDNSIKVEDVDGSDEDDDEGGESNRIRSLKLAQVKIILLKEENKTLRQELNETRRAYHEMKAALEDSNREIDDRIKTGLEEYGDGVKTLFEKIKLREEEARLEEARKNGGACRIGATGLQIGEGIGIFFDDNDSDAAAQITAADGDPDYVKLEKV